MEIEIARLITEEIKRLEREEELLRHAAQNIVPERDGLPKGKSRSSPVERLTIKLLEIEERKRALMDELAAAKVALIEEICAGALSEMEKRVLILRYVGCMRFRDICFELNYSDARIYQWHRAGLEKLQLNYSNELY